MASSEEHHYSPPLSALITFSSISLVLRGRPQSTRFPLHQHLSSTAEYVLSKSNTKWSTHFRTTPFCLLKSFSRIFSKSQSTERVSMVSITHACRFNFVCCLAITTITRRQVNRHENKSETAYLCSRVLIDGEIFVQFILLSSDCEPIPHVVV